MMLFRPAFLKPSAIDPAVTYAGSPYGDGSCLGCLECDYTGAASYPRFVQHVHESHAGYPYTSGIPDARVIYRA